MNKVFLIGRLTADPEIRYTQGENQHTVANFTLAVDRRVARNNGETTADFIRLQAWDKKAEVIEKYLHKGSKIAIIGRIQTGSYEKDGQRFYTTDIVIEELEFCESKAAATAGTTEKPAAPAADSNGFINIPEGIDNELPFA